MAPPGADVFGVGAVGSPHTFFASVADGPDPRVNIIASLLAVLNAAHLTFGIFLILGANARERERERGAAPRRALALVALVALAAETLLLFAALGLLRSRGALPGALPLLGLVASALVTSVAIIILKTRSYSAMDALPTRL